jgi:hypothetical protein
MSDEAYYAAIHACLDRYRPMAVTAERRDLWEFIDQCYDEIGNRAPLHKLNRWLGYIQGVLIEIGCTDVTTERDWSRPHFRPLDFPLDNSPQIPPTRIQLRRTRGWRMPPNTVKVTRPSQWGNPFRVGNLDFRRYVPFDAESAVERFAEWLAAGRLPVTKADVRRELAGKNLACWCAIGSPCHADVLLELANRPVCEEVV